MFLDEFVSDKHDAMWVRLKWFVEKILIDFVPQLQRKIQEAWHLLKEGQIRSGGADSAQRKR
jgi:hypothetical protein